MKTNVATRLDGAFAHLQTQFPAIAQLVLLHHGELVLACENDRPREALVSVLLRRLMAAWGLAVHAPMETFEHVRNGRYNVRSVAKSITSLLVGIALEEKILHSLDQYVADLLPDAFSNEVEPDKRAITLRHLLTMTSGLESIEGGSAGLKMMASNDWTKFILRRPLCNQPGTHFQYNSANPHILSAIITRLTGQSLLSYAEPRLFCPLGITGVVWGGDPAGVTFGGGNLFLTAAEMSRFGQLCLDNGTWQGQQLVPANWLEESWQPYQTVIPGWKYGYYWYLHEEEIGGRCLMTISAAGTAGQKVLLLPKLDVVLAVTAKTDFVGEKGIYLDQMISHTLAPALDAGNPFN